MQGEESGSFVPPRHVSSRWLLGGNPGHPLPRASGSTSRRMWTAGIRRGPWSSHPCPAGPLLPHIHLPPCPWAGKLHGPDRRWQCPGVSGGWLLTGGGLFPTHPAFPRVLQALGATCHLGAWPPAKQVCTERRPRPQEEKQNVGGGFVPGKACTPTGKSLTLGSLSCWPGGLGDLEEEHLGWAPSISREVGGGVWLSTSQRCPTPREGAGLLAPPHPRSTLRESGAPGSMCRGPGGAHRGCSW